MGGVMNMKPFFHFTVLFRNHFGGKNQLKLKGEIILSKNIMMDNFTWVADGGHLVFPDDWWSSMRTWWNRARIDYLHNRHPHTVKAVDTVSSLCLPHVLLHTANVGPGLRALEIYAIWVSQKHVSKKIFITKRRKSSLNSLNTNSFAVLPSNPIWKGWTLFRSVQINKVSHIYKASVVDLLGMLWPVICEN